MKKKQIVLCLVISLFFSMFPFLAYAEEPVIASKAIQYKNPYEAANTLFNDYLYQLEQLNLHVPQKLEITRPNEYLTTTHSAYFITGTSNPEEPLFVNDEEIERQGIKGTFGVLIDLDLAENFISVQQGDKTKEVIINRVEESSVPKEINRILQDSMFPLHQGGTRVGKMLPVSCIAPGGALVMASLGEKTVVLEPIAEVADGVPVRYTAELEVVGSFPADETTKVGPVAYMMTYKGRTERYQSTGDAYVAGIDTNIAVQIKDHIGLLYYDTKTISYYKELVKEGARDYLMTQSNTYSEVYSGGFIPTEMVEIVEGNLKIENKITAYSAQNNSNGEVYSFLGDALPFYDVIVGEEALKIMIQNSSIAGENTPVLAESSLFSEVTVEQGELFVTYTFTFKEYDKYWGYNVLFNDTTMEISIHHKPRLSDRVDHPLEGITIVVDPGHGGTDFGALGVTGETGASEASINLAHGYALENELTKLGATVYLTRDSDNYRSLEDRLKDHENYAPHLFVSLHHNSVDYSVDANKAEGTEAYYHTNMSRDFTDKVTHKIAEASGRPFRSVNQSYYRVTILPYSPAALFELGFISNPREYESSTDFETATKLAKAMAEGIVEVFGEVDLATGEKEKETER